MAAPPSQKWRQISLRLEGGDEAPANFTFTIRPEELTRSEPSRLAVQQTLGGAWADAFGQGVSTINLSGHNGWRGGFLSSGEDLFIQLRDTAFAGWHRRRAEAIKSGLNPNGVSLYFSDSLDQISSLVAPRSFLLRRNRSSPLLIRYNITLIELGDAADAQSIVDQIINALSNPLRWIAGVTGLGNVLNTITNFATQAQNVMGAVAGSVGMFVNIGVNLIQSVSNAAQQVRGEFDSGVAELLAVGSIFSRGASNAFSALAGDQTLSPAQMFPLMKLASAFNDSAGIMSTAFNTGRSYPDYSSLFGASGCSSTGGGGPASPYSDISVNPFAFIFPPLADSISITPVSRDALTALNGDPLLLVGNRPKIIGLMSSAASGIVVQ